jgi:hypothetical protein
MEAIKVWAGILRSVSPSHLNRDEKFSQTFFSLPSIMYQDFPMVLPYKIEKFIILKGKNRNYQILLF